MPSSSTVIQKIVSGGQTGVDRAALDVAIECGVPCGGWCPKGRRAEDGPLDLRYPLQETPSDEYAQRTEWNVRDSDGTLILTLGFPLTGGTAQTVECAKRLRKPHLVHDLAAHPSPSAVLAWATAHQLNVLNIAGPRESRCTGIYLCARRFLHQFLCATPPPVGDRRSRSGSWSDPASGQPTGGGATPPSQSVG